MGNRKDGIQALIKSADTELQKIERAYGESLHAKNISADLQVAIKNLCGNLRSALDYIAHDIREQFCAGANPKDRFYFPILSSATQFQAQVEQWYPGLRTNVPDLWNFLESVQPYHGDWDWLGIFNKINNENKHDKLIPQTRKETEQVRVTGPNTSVTWTPQNVRFGQGVYIGGIPVDPRTQMPVPHPSQTVERLIWVDFVFDGANISALTLLKQAVNGVKRIVADAEKWV